MDPIPLLGMAENHPFERRVERARRGADRLVRVLVLDERQRLFESQHMSSIRLAPARSGQDRRAGGQGDDRKALERACGVTEEFDVDAIGTMRVLVERKHDDVARFEPRDDPIERAALAHHAETCAIEPPRHQLIEPPRLDRSAHEMEAAVNLGIVLNSRDGRDFPIAEMSCEDQNAFAIAESVDERIQIFDAYERASALR